MSTLDLGLIGNCNVAALIDQHAHIVWYCLPRIDGDPIFHQLLGTPLDRPGSGVCTVELDGFQKSEQAYVENTAILRTVLKSAHGDVEIIDFSPRYETRGRAYRPQTLVRQIRPLSGAPRIKILLRPSFDYGANAPALTHGSNHIRYVGSKFTIRLTTDAPIDYVLSETSFHLHEPISLVLGPDETLGDSVHAFARSEYEQTERYWRAWVHRLAIPFEWQEAVIRAAITLKLCTYEPTGAIVAAVTTSIPESPNTQRNWDYRFCWLRDAYFVVRALNSLSAVRTMENYFRWLMNVVGSAEGEHIQPVYGVGLEPKLTERIVESLPGYRGMAPVREGNQAFEHFQFDSYGNVVLGAAQAFMDRRLLSRPGKDEFELLERAGLQAIKLYDQPDAGMWELRFSAKIHTTSSLMCWAACDRLARIARHIHRNDRHDFWQKHADHIKQEILRRSWSAKRQAFVESFEGDKLDAGVLLMTEVGFIDPYDPRFIATLKAIEDVLGRGPFMMRYEAPDDFGPPETAFNICAFWRVTALARSGRKDDARQIFEALLASRNHLGLMSEDIKPDTGEAWGNFPQTYSMVGIINAARLLSRSWDSEI
ncbi:MAG TPA: glycoside hydrolase family 15 protein [Candidatus Obscuribacterales bacterium]|nr:glycoside hydrolase family 15 protein [Candidatus Obscuribacterales bacterium]